MTHGKQCGFAGVLTIISDLAHEKVTPGDPARRNIYLQQKSFPGSGEKFTSRQLLNCSGQVKKREGLRESPPNPQGIKLKPEIDQKSRS